MELQSELFRRNVASTSNIAELENTITGLQNEVDIKKVQRASDVRHFKDLIQKLQQKQQDTE